MTRDFGSDDLVRALEAAGELASVRGTLPARLTGIADDSRRVERGAAFVAVRGHDDDGHRFLESAESKGAAMTIVEDAAATRLPAIVVRNSRRAASIVAQAAFDYPARQLTLVAVTGTNGKTTTVHMLRHLLDEPGARAASIGTLGAIVGAEDGEHVVPGTGILTTPGPVELQRVLRTLADEGVEIVVMEVSSHSLDQARVDGLTFGCAVFTNVTHEHLDYHGTMERYIEAKLKLASYLAENGIAVVNADDPAWAPLLTDPRTVTFGRQSPTSRVTAEDVTPGESGSDWTLVIDEVHEHVHLPLLGDFNITNALGAAAAAQALGLTSDLIAARLASIPQVPGRLEVISDRPVVLRDYAHKPFALESAIKAVRPFVRGRLILVFGCGGDRDRAKRPIMGAIAVRDADRVIITSDNPRTENPETILDEIEQGMNGADHERIEDRRAAIGRALSIAERDDVVLLAGKGHENYQIRGRTTLPFDERQVVAELKQSGLAA